MRKSSTSLLQTWARTERERLLASKPPDPTTSAEERAAKKARRDLLTFIPWATPAYQQPVHLMPLVKAFRRINAGEAFREGYSAPPQHAKTDTVLHGIAWLLDGHPEWPIGYVTYGADLSKEKSRSALRIARDARIPLNPNIQAAEHWETAKGGGVHATGILGDLTGRGLRVLFVDDPFRNRVEAESAVYRKRVWEWILSVGETRMAPNGCIVLFATRWHPDDPIGAMEREWAAKYFRMPAISDDGEPLWPARYSLAQLEQKKRRVGIYNWESMYQGRPRPRGAKVFNDLFLYEREALPLEHFREGVGVDLAYTAKSSADHSIALIGRAVGSGDEMKLYLTELHREQVRAKTFRGVLKSVRRRHQTAAMAWYTSTTEKGTAELMDDEEVDVGLAARPAVADKLIRAGPASVAWNDGRILCPKDVDWSEPPWSDFQRVVLGFTGVNDSEDDDVDALAALWDEMAGGAVVQDELADPKWEGVAAIEP